MHELVQVCNEEGTFDGKINDKEYDNYINRNLFIVEINAQQAGGHQHGNGDGKSIGRFHVR